MKRTSISFKINAITLSVCVMFIFVSSFFLYFLRKKHLKYEYNQINTFLSVLFEQKREEIANEIFAHQDMALNSSLDDMIKVKGVLKVVTYNKKGMVLLSMGKHLFKENQAKKKSETANALSKKQTRILDQRSVFLKEIQGSKNIAAYLNSIKVIGEQVGYIKIYYDVYPIKHHIAESVTIFLFLSLLLTIFILLLFNVLFSRFIVKPVLKLKQAMETVEKGTLGGQVDLSSKDEIGEIGGAFNKMSETLLQNHIALTDAVKKEEKYSLELAEANDALKDLNASLENIVKQRTSDLLKANTSLKKEMEEKEKMKESLLRVQKLESIGLLAGGIAHDFNNILGVIVGNLCLARASLKKEDKIAKYLIDTEESCFRARDLTNQLLTFSKGGAPVKKLISMAEFIKESVIFVLRGSNVGYEVSIDPDLFHAKIDKGQINQVINNIIINALQAMKDGGTITVKAQNFMMPADNISIPLTPGNYIKISIKDQGEGIARENLQSIFDPYFTTKQNGNGLGLATVHSIVKRHGGYIGVQSEKEKGATFFIYLPASKEKLDDTASKIENAQDIPIKGHQKILIMDDEKMIREVVGDMLIHMGYQVDFAEDGVEACRKYRESMEKQEKFDAAIMDLTIPGGMGGKQAVKEILKMDPNAKVVVSSGYSNDPVMADYKSYGFSGVVVKPFKMKELNSLMQELFT